MWKWQHWLKWLSNVTQGHRTWYQSKARIRVASGLHYSNFRRITHRFRDTSCFNAENHIFAYPTCIWPWIWRLYHWNVETKSVVGKVEVEIVSQTGSTNNLATETDIDAISKDIPLFGGGGRFLLVYMPTSPDASFTLKFKLADRYRK